MTVLHHFVQIIDILIGINFFYIFKFSAVNCRNKVSNAKEPKANVSKDQVSNDIASIGSSVDCDRVSIDNVSKKT